MTPEEQTALEVTQNQIVKVLGLVQELYRLNDDELSGKFQDDITKYELGPDQINATKEFIKNRKVEILTTLKAMAEAFLSQGN